MSVQMQKFGAWSKKHEHSNQKRTVQAVLGLPKRAATAQMHSDCGASGCNCGGGCNGECNTSCSSE